MLLNSLALPSIWLEGFIEFSIKGGMTKKEKGEWSPYFLLAFFFAFSPTMSTSFAKVG